MSISTIGRDGTNIAADTNGLPITTNQVITRLGGVTAQPNFIPAVKVYYEKDAGTVTGNAYLVSPEVSDDRRLAVGLDTPLFNDSFNSTTQNTALWRHQFTTMTMTLPGAGFLLCNASDTTTTTTGCQYTTWRQFPIWGNGGTHVEMIGTPGNAPLANQTFEFGLFPYGASATVAPVDGVYFRLDSAGLIAVINYNGTETTSGVLQTTGQLGVGVKQWKIVCNQRSVEFFLDDSFLTEIVIPAGNGTAFQYNCLPISIQQRNSGTITGSPRMQFKVSNVHVDLNDLNINKPYPGILSSMGQMGSQGQNGQTVGSTALYTNSLAPGAGAVMTNTTAALGTGLGGQFAALPTLAANTDGIMCSFLNPVGSINITPRTLYIRGIWVDSCITTVLVGNATPVVYFYSLAYGHTALSMATGESASFATGTAKAPRRLAIGSQSFAAAAAVGTMGTGGKQQITFACPIVVNPGEYVAICAKNVGVVTTTGVVCFLTGFDAYWE